MMAANWWPSWISERNILAILNLYVAQMPPTKCLFNPMYGLRRDILFEEYQDSCHGGHLGHQKRMVLAILNFHVACDASHQVLVQSDKWLRDLV